MYNSTACWQSGDITSSLTMNHHRSYTFRPPAINAQPIPKPKRMAYLVVLSGPQPGIYHDIQYTFSAQPSITADFTPQGQKYGRIFSICKIFGPYFIVQRTLWKHESCSSVPRQQDWWKRQMSGSGLQRGRRRLDLRHLVSYIMLTHTNF